MVTDSLKGFREGQREANLVEKCPYVEIIDCMNSANLYDQMAMAIFVNHKSIHLFDYTKKK